ncbi:MAG: T9SS type A sorting domain-containing protein [Saprospiraceae bacterium]
MRTIIFLFLSNVLFGQVPNPQFEAWDLYNGREKPAEWYCPNLCSGPDCGPCNKIVQGVDDYAVRIHNVMPCVSSDNQAKRRSAGFIHDYFMPTSTKFKISFDLIIDSIEPPAEFIFTIGDFVWKTDQILSERIEQEIILEHSYDSLFIQFQCKGYLKQNPLHNCDLGYLSAIIDSIETEDIVSTKDLKSVNIYVVPNPFNTTLTIEGEHPSVSWSIFDFTGHLIMDGNSSEIYGLNKLAQGIYMLHIMDGAKTYFKKIVKE